MSSLRDERAAARKTQREAERYPLLARLGMTRTWTGEELAERRERLHAEALANAARSREQLVADIARYRDEILTLAGEEGLRLVEAHVAASRFADEAEVGMPLWSLWYLARERARRGEPVVEPPPAFVGKPRAPVAPEVVLKALRGRTQPAGVQDLEDRLEGSPHILDVLAALRELRARGLAQTGPRGGWVAVSP